MRPVVVDEVDDKTLDVRTVLILNKPYKRQHLNLYLISHNHNFPIAQRFHLLFGCILEFVVVDSKNFNQRVDLSIVHELLVTAFSNVQHFTTQWKNSVTITSNDPEPGNCQRFCGISFCEDECTEVRVL